VYDSGHVLNITRYKFQDGKIVLLYDTNFICHTSRFSSNTLSRTEVSFALATSVMMYFALMKEKKRRQRKKYEDPGWNVREVVSEQPPTVVEI